MLDTWSGRLSALLAIAGAVASPRICDSLFGFAPHWIIVFLVLYPVISISLWITKGLIFDAKLMFSGRELRAKRMELLETGCGRFADWTVERNGRPIAVLTQPRSADMFWVRYLLNITTPDEQERDALIKSPMAWCGLKFRSQITGTLAEGWANPPDAEGNVLARGLYFFIEDPSFLESSKLWWRRQRK